MATVNVDVEVDLTDFDDEEIEEYYFQYINTDIKKTAEKVLASIREHGSINEIEAAAQELALAVTGRLV